MPTLTAPAQGNGGIEAPLHRELRKVYAISEHLKMCEAPWSATDSSICHPERGEGSLQLNRGSTLSEQLPGSFAALRMTGPVDVGAVRRARPQRGIVLPFMAANSLDGGMKSSGLCETAQRSTPITTS